LAVATAELTWLDRALDQLSRHPLSAEALSAEALSAEALSAEAG
jgi:hypothetical protein